MFFQAHSLRCRFGGLLEISDLNGEDSVFKMSLLGTFQWEEDGWGQSEIRAHSRHLRFVLPSHNKRQEGGHSELLLLLLRATMRYEMDQFFK